MAASRLGIEPWRELKDMQETEQLRRQVVARVLSSITDIRDVDVDALVVELAGRYGPTVDVQGIGYDRWRRLMRRHQA